MRITGYSNRSDFPPLFLFSIFLLLFLFPETLPAQSGRPGNPRIPDRVREHVERQGSVRVIAQLALPGTTYAPEPELGTGLAVATQRQRIAAARATLLNRLWNTRHEVKRQYRTLPYVALEVDAGGLAELEAAHGDVLNVFEDRLSRPVLDGTTPIVQGPEAWSSGFDGTGTVAAILDTGVDKTHSFLVDRVVEEACYSANGNCPNGHISQTGSGAGALCAYAPQDCDHGTHVAGIAAGSGATAGVGFSGVAPGAEIMSIQVFSRFDNPDCNAFGIPYSPCALSYSSDQIAALERIYELRNTYNFASANLSLGGGFSSQTCDAEPIKDAIDNLRAAGIPTVIAAGNNGFIGGTSFPACVSTAVSVGATTDADGIASFTNNASFLSLLAPGVSVNSSIPGGSFASFSGTSMATPHVAGAFAVLKQAFPSDTVDEILALLKGTGKFITDTDSGIVINKPRISLCSALAVLTEIQFGALFYSVSEGAGNAPISLNRSGGCLFNSASVGFQTSPGTATPGLDYTTASGTLSFAPGVPSQVFQVGITDDNLAEPDETVNLFLLPPLFGSVGRFNGQYSGTYLSSTSPALGGDIAFTVTNGGVQILDPGSGKGSVSNSGVFSGSGSGGPSGGSCSYSGTFFLAADGTPGASGTFACGGSVNGFWSAAHFRPRLGSPVTAELTIIDNDEGGVLQFSLAEFTVGERGRRATIAVTRTEGTAGGVTVDYSTSDGTATAGQDYTPVSGTLTFGAGQTSRTFTIPILNDNIVDPDETINLTLSNPFGATLGPQQTAVLTIIDDDLGGVISFSAGNYNGAEPTGSSPRNVSITVRRTGGKASGVTVQYMTSDGTATAGEDYVSTFGTLTFAAGAKSQKFTVPILHDTRVEDSETINLTLFNPTGGATLGPLSTSQITIKDNDRAGTIQFSATTYQVNENAGSALIAVHRAKGNASDVTVQYATADGTAIEGTDYDRSAGTLTFDTGVASLPFTVPIVDRPDAQGARTVNLMLSDPGGGGALGSRQTAILQILDSATPGGAGMAAQSITATPEISIMQSGL